MKFARQSFAHSTNDQLLYICFLEYLRVTTSIYWNYFPDLIKISKMGSMSNGDVLGQEFTDHVVQAMGPETTPRMRTVMTALIQHVHDFAREVDLTTEEWLAGVAMLNWAGQMSNDKRNEGQLVCDVIGLESYVTLFLI